jgi:hypothetical protein
LNSKKIKEAITKNKENDILKKGKKYTEAVWNLVAASFNLPSYLQLQSQGGPAQRFQVILDAGEAKDKTKRSGILLTVWWMIWKERNRRILTTKSAQLRDWPPVFKKRFLCIA